MELAMIVIKILLGIATIVTLFAAETSGKPQQRRIMQHHSAPAQEREQEPRWSTQRTNHFAGADQDLTLPFSQPLPDPDRQTPQLIFPSRFQPIVGPTPQQQQSTTIAAIVASSTTERARARAMVVEQKQQQSPVQQSEQRQQAESRVQHNYYPPEEFSASNLNQAAVSPPIKPSLHYLPPPRAKPTVQTLALEKSATAEASSSSSPGVSTNHSALPDNREIRFLIHAPGDEEIIKRALYEDSLISGDQVSFLQGPTLKLEQKQKVVLPPKRKTIVYVFIKEPEIETKVEMVESPETAGQDSQPQVFVFYQKSNGANKQHYPTKGAKIVAATAAVNSGGTTTTTTAAPPPPISNSVFNSNVGTEVVVGGKAAGARTPSASNQIEQTVSPPPPGCPTQFGGKN